MAKFGQKGEARQDISLTLRMNMVRNRVTNKCIADVKGVEIPFYEKKDRIVRMSSFF